ncbi:MAG TPA: hypothetical protein VNZ54_10955 [bacterium]|nr:hypothetical protein [bacterium]
MIHVVMPFSRKQNLPFYLDAFSRQTGVVWHPVATEDLALPQEPWVRPLLVGDTGYGDVCYGKIQAFIDRAEIVDSDTYCVLCDDDWYEAGFFDKIRRFSFDLVVASMARGQRIPSAASPHDITTLWAGDMKPCHVGVEQLFFKGRIFRRLRYPDTGTADGLIAQHVAAVIPFLCVRSAFVLFNYLEPGRWDLDDHTRSLLQAPAAA